MESTTRTEEFQPASEPSTTAATAVDARPSMSAAIRERCSACGVAMASDQRYCVECGQRRGPARVPFVDGIAQPTREAPTARRSPQRRARTSVDATLIAGIGTLLLAMGIGVLIGRSSNGASSKSARVQVVTVAGGGGPSSGAAATTTASGASVTSTTKAAASHAKVSATLAAKKAAAGPPPKVVTVGSPGHGPGYQSGHFTGNFFGP